ncbi:hypothetical protein BSKO_02421, partial [Bryopsis sp. KO-2023]
MGARSIWGLGRGRPNRPMYRARPDLPGLRGDPPDDAIFEGRQYQRPRALPLPDWTSIDGDARHISEPVFSSPVPATRTDTFAAIAEDHTPRLDVDSYVFGVDVSRLSRWVPSGMTWVLSSGSVSWRSRFDRYSADVYRSSLPGAVMIASGPREIWLYGRVTWGAVRTMIRAMCQHEGCLGSIVPIDQPDLTEEEIAEGVDRDDVEFTGGLLPFGGVHVSTDVLVAGLEAICHDFVCVYAKGVKTPLRAFADLVGDEESGVVTGRPSSIFDFGCTLPPFQEGVLSFFRYARETFYEHRPDTFRQVPLLTGFAVGSVSVQMPVDESGLGCSRAHIYSCLSHVVKARRGLGSSWQSRPVSMAEVYRRFRAAFDFGRFFTDSELSPDVLEHACSTRVEFTSIGGDFREALLFVDGLSDFVDDGDHSSFYQDCLQPFLDRFFFVPVPISTYRYMLSSILDVAALYLRRPASTVQTAPSDIHLRIIADISLALGISSLFARCRGCAFAVTSRNVYAGLLTLFYAWRYAGFSHETYRAVCEISTSAPRAWRDFCGRERAFPTAIERFIRLVRGMYERRASSTVGFTLTRRQMTRLFGDVPDDTERVDTVVPDSDIAGEQIIPTTTLPIPQSRGRGRGRRQQFSGRPAWMSPLTRPDTSDRGAEVPGQDDEIQTGEGDEGPSDRGAQVHTREDAIPTGEGLLDLGFEDSRAPPASAPAPASAATATAAPASAPAPASAATATAAPAPAATEARTAAPAPAATATPTPTATGTRPTLAERRLMWRRDAAPYQAGGVGFLPSGGYLGRIQPSQDTIDDCRRIIELARRRHSRFTQIQEHGESSAPSIDEVISDLLATIGPTRVVSDGDVDSEDQDEGAPAAPEAHVVDIDCDDDIDMMEVPVHEEERSPETGTAPASASVGASAGDADLRGSELEVPFPLLRDVF